MITLAKLLRIRPNLWNEEGDCLEKFGIKNSKEKIHEGLKDLEKPTKNASPVPLNKVGEYCEDEDGNTTLPVEYQGIKTLATLDSGVGVAIATKDVWKQWKKSTMRAIRMKL